MTDVTDRPTNLDQPPQRNRALIVVLLALVLVALVGLAVVLVNDGSETASSAELPEEAAQVVDDYRSAWMNQDVEGFYATITDDFFSTVYYYGAEQQTLWETWVRESSGPEQAARYMEFDDPIELVEVRDQLVSGDGPWIVTTNEVWETANGASDGARFRWDRNMTYVIVEDAGTIGLASVVVAGTITELEE